MSMIHQCSEEQWSALLAALRERHDRDEAETPDDRSALLVMFRGYDRLRQLGWREISYCPKDGSTFEVIEAGSSGIHRAHYEGDWPDGHWWIHEAGDLWPAHPILFRLIQDAAQGIEAEGRNTEGGSVHESPVDKVDAPPSLPPTGEGLPEEIVKAIDALEAEAELYGEGCGYRYDIAKARSTLDATILHYLSAAQRCCDSYARENQQLSDKADAALARAERAERALMPFAKLATDPNVMTNYGTSIQNVPTGLWTACGLNLLVEDIRAAAAALSSVAEEA